MSETNSSATQPDLPSVNFERIFDAPPELVFRAWTEPERLKRWIAPDGFTTPTAEIDPRVGGAMNFVMRGPDGTDYPSTGVFREFEPPHRFVMTSSIPGPDGAPILQEQTTVSFEPAEGSKTRLLVHSQITMMVGDGLEYARGMEEGWGQSLSHLAEEVTRP